MDSNKTLAAPGYAVAAMLFLIPLSDALAGILPLQLGNERWRFGAIGSIISITILPLVALFLATAVAAVFEHRRFRRILGWLNGLLTLIVAVMLIMFVLDFFQERMTVRPQFLHTIDVATEVALVKGAFTLLILILLTRAGLSGPKALLRRTGVKTAPGEATPLIPLRGSVPVE